MMTLKKTLNNNIKKTSPRKEEIMGKNLKGKELGAGISQRKDGRYQGRYTDRFGNRKYVYDNQLQELRLKLRQAMSDNDNHLNVCDNKITLNEWFEIWIETYKQNCRNTSINYYRTSFNRITETLGKMKLCDLNHITVQRAINKIETSQAQKATLIVLKAALDKAMKEELLVKNPANDITTKSKKVKEQYVFTDETLEVFLQEIKKSSCYPICIVALNTGMRINEILGLTWDCIDWTNNRIHVKQTLVYLHGKFELHEPKTDSGARTIPMLPVVVSILKDQYKRRLEMNLSGIKPLEGFENMVFFTGTNYPIHSNYIRATLIRKEKQLRKKYPDLNIGTLHPHTFRHTFATRALKNGMQPKALQKILGHSTLSMTMDLYAHVLDDTIESEMNKLLVSEAVSN